LAEALLERLELQNQEAENASYDSEVMNGKIFLTIFFRTTKKFGTF
jgi:hypothetical protein